MKRSNPAVTPNPAQPARKSLGTRVMMWKQDPSVSEIGMRKVYLPNKVLDGPRDEKIMIKGLSLVLADKTGDFIETKDSQSFDAVHTFTVVRQTLTMYQRALTSGGHPA